MRWPWQRQPAEPLPPILKNPPTQHTHDLIVEIERESREARARINRSTDDLLLLLAEMERRKEATS